MHQEQTSAQILCLPETIPGWCFNEPHFEVKPPFSLLFLLTFCYPGENEENMVACISPQSDTMWMSVAVTITLSAHTLSLQPLLPLLQPQPSPHPAPAPSLAHVPQHTLISPTLQRGKVSTITSRGAVECGGFIRLLGE